MEENKVRVQLKPGIESGRIHTTGFDLVLAPGETAEVTEEQFQRHVLVTGLFEVEQEKTVVSRTPPILKSSYRREHEGE